MSGTLYQELVTAFGKEATEEIVARVMCGESLDSAMQTVLDEED
jgi:hypothetical protein